MTSSALKVTKTMCDKASWYCAVFLTMLLLCTFFSQSETFSDDGDDARFSSIRRNMISSGRPCEEIYVVGEGETLNAISDKCGDPFIVERNPHINDPDDVFPGLVIRIIPTRMIVA